MKKRIGRRDFLGKSGKVLLASGLSRLGSAAPVFAAVSSVQTQSDYFIFPAAPGIIEEAPGKIVEAGRIRLGYFRSPVREMNLSEARVLKGLIRNYPEFIGYGITHPDWYFGTIILDPKVFPYISSIYAYDRRSGRLFSHDRLIFGKQGAVAGNTWDGESFAVDSDFMIRFRHRLQEGYHEIKIDIPQDHDKPAVQADLKLFLDLKSFEPLTVSMLVEPRYWCYTQKAFLPIAGEMTIGRQKIVFDPRRDLAGLDESRNLAPFRFGWTWGTCAGFDGANGIVGMNAGVRTQMPDGERWNENCAWIDGKISLLGDVAWELDPDHPKKPWRLKDKRGRFDLEYYPDGKKNIGSRSIGISYFQTCGEYEGTLQDEAGKTHSFNTYYGTAEQGMFGWP
ncbi:MAG: DUF2804 family protein [bacterium]|nr:DUF2804 family protein [bacterium]